MPRPRLHDHARPLRRGAGSLQIGVDPDSGVVLEGLTSDEIRVLERLDGSEDVDVLRGRCADPDRFDALLLALRRHALVTDTHADPAVFAALGPAREDLSRDAAGRVAAYGIEDGFRLLLARRRRRVVVAGSGSVVAGLASLLRSGGVGRVTAGPHAADALDLDLRSGHGTPVDLVVLVTDGALPLDGALPWWRREVPVLPVVTHPARVAVGPLLAAGGPCAACLDLARSDVDPAWPLVLRQLTRAARVRGESGTESALGVVAVGLAALLVHDRLDTGRAPDGAGVEAVLPLPRLVHRRWSVHPDCPWHPASPRMDV